MSSESAAEEDGVLDLSALSSRRSEARQLQLQQPSAAQSEQHSAPKISTKRKKDRKTKSKVYEEKAISDALTQIKEFDMPVYTAAIAYGVPRTTLQYRMSSEYKNKGSPGPYPVFSKEEENDIVSWILEMERKGFAATEHTLKYKVSNFLKIHPRPNPFTDNIPGKAWFKGFLERHPDVSIRTAESVTDASSRVTEEDIRNWFRRVYKHLEDNKLTHILNDPARVLNGDESGFSMNPKPKRVLGKKGKKDISFIESTNSKQNITVMFTFSADGRVIPPQVIVKSRLDQDTLKAFPSNWGIGTSANGWMNTPNFVGYVRKVLHPALKKRGTKFPVLFFVDNHSSHAALEAADACMKLGIILIGLYPNCTRITQPADVAIFKPLKDSWRKVTDEWRVDNPGQKMTLAKFTPLLKKAMKSSFKVSTIIHGFAACGLYPFNANAINYEKCLGKSANSRPPIELCGPAHDSVDDVPAEVSDRYTSIQVAVPQGVLKTAVEMLGPSKINLYLSTEASKLTHEDKVLSYIYKNVLVLGDSSRCDNIQQAEHSNDDGDVYEDDDVYEDADVYEDDDVDDDGNVNEDDDVDEDVNANDAEEDDDYRVELLFDDDFPNAVEVPVNALTEACEVPPLLGECSSHHSEKLPHVSYDEYEVQAEGTVSTLTDITNQRLETKPRISDYLTTPPTPKRNPKHRNYTIQTNPVLTAFERLEQLREREENKMKAAEQKKKRAEIREIRKKEREIAKQEAAARKAEKALKRKAEAEQKKNVKKRKLTRIVL